MTTSEKGAGFDGVDLLRERLYTIKNELIDLAGGDLQRSISVLGTLMVLHINAVARAMPPGEDQADSQHAMACSMLLQVTRLAEQQIGVRVSRDFATMPPPLDLDRAEQLGASVVKLFDGLSSEIGEGDNIGMAHAIGILMAASSMGIAQRMRQELDGFDVRPPCEHDKAVARATLCAMSQLAEVYLDNTESVPHPSRLI